MTLPNASEIEFIDLLLGLIAHKRHAFVKHGKPIEPVRVGYRVARGIESAIANGHLYPDDTNLNCFGLNIGETWIASLDGVHVIEVVEQ